jgi:hypothetical protein
MTSFLLSLSLSLYIYIYIYIDTHTCAILHLRCRILFYTQPPKPTHRFEPTSQPPGPQTCNPLSPPSARYRVSTPIPPTHPEPCTSFISPDSIGQRPRRDLLGRVGWRRERRRGSLTAVAREAPPPRPPSGSLPLGRRPAWRSRRRVSRLQQFVVGKLQPREEEGSPCGGETKRKQR